MNALFELTIERKKLVIKQLREVTIHDLVPVRETLNSIDFILGDDDHWEYSELQQCYEATTKFRLYFSEQILKFVKDNKNKLKMNSIDQVFLTDLTKVYKIEIELDDMRELKRMDKDSIARQLKQEVYLDKIKEAVTNINDLASTMGEIN